MGCGASAVTESVTQHHSTTQTEEKKDIVPTPHRKRWVCGRCTLHNKEGSERCGACGGPFDDVMWAVEAPREGDGMGWAPAAHSAISVTSTTATAGSGGAPAPHAPHDAGNAFVHTARSNSSSSGSSSSTWRKSRKANSVASEADNCQVHFLWCAGEEAETCVDGVWVPCRVILATKSKVEIQVNGETQVKEHSDVRRPRLAECCICLEPLCVKLLGALVDEHGARVCRHYVHKTCGSALPVQTCPVCRAEFAHVVQVPRADRHPREWFNVIGYSKTGSLSPQEVKAALSAVVPFSEDEVYAIIKEKWGTWDPANTGYIRFEQVESVVNHFFM